MIDHLGFTGTKAGMTEEQKAKVHWLLREFRPKHVHHGQCVGADKQFHEIAGKIGIARIVHPPLDERYKADIEFRPGDVVLAPQPYLARNQHIVDDCDILVAAPRQDNIILRSGTWATVRRGLDKPMRVIIVKPDGRHHDT